MPGDSEAETIVVPMKSSLRGLDERQEKHLRRVYLHPDQIRPPKGYVPPPDGALMPPPRCPQTT